MWIMRITEQILTFPIQPGTLDFLDQVRNTPDFPASSEAVPVRFAVTKSESAACECEVGVLEGLRSEVVPDPLFRYRERGRVRHDNFNVVFIVPTGIGAAIGGHAGDATPAVRMFAGICDNLITHPNAVNASDLNEMTENTLYVEGSVLTRLLMGTVGLGKVRSNRVLTIIDSHTENVFVHAAVNAVSAARASFGLNCTNVIKMEQPVRLSTRYTDLGRTISRIENFKALYDVLEKEHNHFDAVAIASVIDVPEDYHQDYFVAGGELANPWGQAEALLTHTISTLFNVPSAHSPMLETSEIANADVGIVEPRLAAEAVSMAFLHCVLKGLHRSPSIILDPNEIKYGSDLCVEDIDCLVIPAGCLGVPTYAALQQRIPVIAVRENTNLMQNNLSVLPWSEGQFFEVDNYLEAAGLVAAMRAGVDPTTIRRPLDWTMTQEVTDLASQDAEAVRLESIAEEIKESQTNDCQLTEIKEPK